MKTTLCITTHCVKTETGGIYKGISNIVPSAPSARMVEFVIEDFLNKSSIKEDDLFINIGFDKREYRSIDSEYEQNLKILSKKFKNFKVIVNSSNIDDPILTAPINFLKLIGSVETDTYILWEHDWILNKNIDFTSLIDLVSKDNDVNYIRINQFNNNNERYNNLINEEKEFSGINLIPTFRWSNNPYICKTNIFNDWWSTFVYPTSNDGGFVEGPLNEFFSFYIEKMGFELANKKFGCYVLGKWGDDPNVSHLNGNSWF
jgi:hypothetical protein